jgi:CheY-like chemotaxis protein
MEKLPSPIRGLINDLTRTLTGSLVHMDDLLLHLDNDSGEFDDAWLANHQLGRALEFFIELRSEYMIQQESINQEKTKYYKSTAVENLLHIFNNLLAVVVGYCDMMQNEFANVPHNCQITDHIYKSIQKSHYLLNETISLPEYNGSINRLDLSYKKNKPKKTVSFKKPNVNNNILLIEDDKEINNIISNVLRKNEYTVVECFTGEKALSIFERPKANIVLCIVDVGLPDIEGPELVKLFLLQKPNINILFTSGYNEQRIKKQFPLIGQYPILIKPFRLEKLLNKMRSILIH